MQPAPLIFKPLFKERIWGGQRLRALLNKTAPADKPIGESWELVDLPEEQSIVSDGPHAGQTLRQLVESWGGALLGRAELFEGSFPLLIKFLDAQQNLSVQVHPDERKAQQLGGHVRVKHEAWYILDAEPGACIYKGLRAGVTRDMLRESILAGTCVDHLHRIEVKAGDCHYLPSGTVHALGAGVVVAEVQTPSDVTYRLFDWNRVDQETGQPRQLHIEDGLDCVHTEPVEVQRRSHVASYWTTVTRLVSCPSFTIEKVRMVAGLEQKIPYAEPVVWVVLSGSGQVLYSEDQTLDFKLGDTVLLPAGLQQGRVMLNEDSVWLEVTLPSQSDLAGFERPSAKQLREPSGGAGSPIQINLPPSAGNTDA